ncbi:hypothetical protein SBA3_3490011 [Candidatus Sulfopaludibacter sp. SbA3]|nr:hypothetical protein SBA3_3490011 [Candidatus Sulfopaludibacter sp. SbA3]
MQSGSRRCVGTKRMCSPSAALWLWSELRVNMLAQHQSAVLAFDLGATSGRAILSRVDKGKLTFQEVHRFQNEPVRHNGHMQWDMPRLRHEMRTGLSRAGECGGPIARAVPDETAGPLSTHFRTIGRQVGRLISTSSTCSLSKAELSWGAP